MDRKKYYVGLDMGTNTVGWAVTDEKYNILRAKGKDMWGIREFSEAMPAADRRTHRVSRRNHQREQVRIGFLKDYFADEIKKTDPNFFVRLENSFFFMEDKDAELSTKDAIFADKDYKDANYYKDYPTIFHLKYALITDRVENDDKYARKLYLALLNYFKRRGHFLNMSLSGSSEGKQDVWNAYKELCDILEKECDICMSVNEEIADQFREIMSDRNISRSRKKERLMELTGTEKKQVAQTLILTAICGLKVDLNKLFEIEGEKKIDLEFSSSSFDDNLPEILANVGQDKAEIIEKMKSVYDSGVLSSVMVGVNWLSEARIRDYNKHKEDLQRLKACIKKYCDDTEYDYLFRADEDGTYSAYVGSVNSGKKKRRGEHLRKSKSSERYENLKKRIRKDLGSFTDDADVIKILEELDTETFLPKQLTFANGVIPNQLHEREMRKILENAEKKLEFLKNKDEYGLSVSERIIKLFTFQLPYFIGPVSQEYQGNGWAVRKTGMEKVQITPWNIEDVIDFHSTNEAFISRMIRKCTYISGENTLPKESMVYQRFMVLNIINNLRISNEKISVELKQRIYEDLYSKGKKVTKTGIAEYLYKKGYLNDKSLLSGIDENPGCSLSTYNRFYQVLGETIQKDSIINMVEKIVFWATIYGDSKKMLREKITENYGEILNQDQIKRIVGFKFKDWGNLSKEFLEISGCNTETGEITSLIRALWEDNCNVMELLHSNKYTFGESLKEKMKKSTKTLSEFSFEDLQDTYFSAPVKRMIWQTLQILKEIEKIMKCPPDKIFVEMTRTDEEKGNNGRKDSREKNLLELYKSIKDERDWKKEIEEAGGSGKLRSKKLFLYYCQMGKDMYTGLPIPLEDLWDDNKYDIDHIFPRHFVKDDSIHNNLVLVDKRKNSRKSDTYPIDSSIRNNIHISSLWTMLRDKKLISEEKYRRLTGHLEFSEEQKADFIARQMVETGQATKGVNDLLKEIMPGVTIVYSKAGNVSDFRRDYGFIKTRLLNDFHHANDAYLNIVVGNVYFTKFTANPINFIKKGNIKYHLTKMFDYDVERDGYTAWIAPKKDKYGNPNPETGTLRTIKNMLNKNTPLMTRLALTQHGAISDATIYGAYKAKEDGYLPIKTNDNRLRNVERYGGFGSAKNAYFFLVEHEVPGKGREKGKMVKIRTIECLPLHKQAKIEKDEEGLKNYCHELGLINPVIRVNKIRPQSLLIVNGFPMYITGKSSAQYVVRNAANLVVDKKWHKVVHDIEKKEIDRIDEKDLIELFEILLKKNTEGLLAKRPGMIGKTLVDGKEKFYDLSKERKAYIIEQILNLSLICNSATADLQDIGGSGKSGAGRMARQISGYESVILVCQSVTGLYEKEIDLLKV